MSEQPKPIFRESALERYQQKKEQGVLLRISYPPALIFFWVFLFALVCAAAFAFSIRIPVTAQGQGILVAQKGTGQSGVDAELFFSPGQLAHLHTGQPATISISSLSGNVSGIVEHVDTNLISPNEARSRFNLQGGLAQVITGPSILVTIRMASAPSASTYAGSLCSAQVQTGSQSVLSLLPGFH